MRGYSSDDPWKQLQYLILKPTVSIEMIAQDKLLTRVAALGTTSSARPEGFGMDMSFFRANIRRWYTKVPDFLNAELDPG
jgi:hypothetical protein